MAISMHVNNVVLLFILSVKLIITVPKFSHKIYLFNEYIAEYD